MNLSNYTVPHHLNFVNILQNNLEITCCPLKNASMISDLTSKF